MRYFLAASVWDRGQAQSLRLGNLALVSNDGREFYRELPARRMPSTDEYQALMDDIVAFVGDDTPQFVTWYGAPTWVCWSHVFLMGGLPSRPGWPLVDIDLAQIITMAHITLPSVPPPLTLDLARWIAEMFRWITNGETVQERAEKAKAEIGSERRRVSVTREHDPAKLGLWLPAAKR